MTIIEKFPFLGGFLLLSDKMHKKIIFGAIEVIVKYYRFIHRQNNVFRYFLLLFDHVQRVEWKVFLLFRMAREEEVKSRLLNESFFF